MRNKLLIIFFLMLVLLINTYGYFAEELIYMSMSAREKSLGNRYVADINATSSNKVNTSLLPFNLNQKIFFNYNNIYQGMIKIFSVGYVFPKNIYGATISYSSFDLGEFTIIEDEESTYKEVENIKLSLFNFGMGYKLRKDLSLGLNFRYFDSRFLGFNTSFFSTDVSFFYMLGKFNIGGLIEDIISSEIQVEGFRQKLLSKMLMGVNYKYNKIKHIDEINIELDFSQKAYNLSLEIKVENFSFRVGLDSYTQNIGLGFGFIFSRKVTFKIDYGYNFSILEEKYRLSNLHSLSFIFIP